MLMKVGVELKMLNEMLVNGKARVTEMRKRKVMQEVKKNNFILIN